MTLPPKAQDLNLPGLRERARGGDHVPCCTHPDLSDILDVDHPDRKCALDIGRRSDCDIAEHDAIPRKEACPFWKSLQRTTPRGATPEETVALLDALQASELRAQQAEARVEELNRALVDHNDLLRSAFSAAQRDAAHDVRGTTNYRTLADRAHEVLTKHHATVNAARVNRPEEPA